MKRVTKETNVSVKINLDGTGVADCSSGIPFLDHMLDVKNCFFAFFFPITSIRFFYWVKLEMLIGVLCFLG